LLLEEEEEGQEEREGHREKEEGGMDRQTDGQTNKRSKVK